MSRAVILLFTLFLSLANSSGSAPIPINFPQARHDLHFTNAIQRWDEALPLGNGIMGALVWGNGRPLNISLDRTDLWDLTPVPEFQQANYNIETVLGWRKEGRHQDLIRLLEHPYNRPAPTRIPAGRIELDLGEGEIRENRLSLKDATASVCCNSTGGISVYLHALRPIGFIRIRNPGKTSVRLAPPAFGGKVMNAAAGGIGAGDLAQLNYPPPEFQADENSQSFLQRGTGGFSFAGWLAWKQNGNEWIAVWSLASSFEGRDPLAIARARAEQALNEDFEEMHADHRRWWEQFWKKSSVSLPNAVLERQWYLETYKFGSAARTGAPPISLQGPWTADDGQLPPWKGDYHHDLNTQLSYWPCYSGNHLEEGLPYLEWLWNTRSNCIAWTKKFFGLPGLNVPMTTDLNNNQIGGWRQYTHSFTTAAWLAQHFYLHWKFSCDVNFLRDRAWPYLREASIFIEAATAARDRNGYRTLTLSSSPEIHDNRPEAWFNQITNYDLALIRWLLGATAELADALELPDEVRQWRKVQSEFPQWALGEDGKLLVAPGEPLRESHRHFSHLMAMHPLGLIDGPSAESRRIVESSLHDLEGLGTDAWCGYSYAWLGNLWARGGNGEKAACALEIFSSAFTLPNSFHANGDQSGKGYSKFTYRPFTLEGNFAAAAGIQEMLLQSHRGRLEIFPAVPTSWKDIAFTTLRAQGAFLVSAQRRESLVQSLEIIAEKGGVCRLRSPWDDTELSNDLRPGERWLLTHREYGQGEKTQ